MKIKTLNSINLTDLDNGLYQINWKLGGYSLAVVCRNARGDAIYCCDNHISGCGNDWEKVESIQLIKTRKEDATGK